MFKKLLSLIIIAQLFSGCVYTKIKMPLDEDVNNTELGSKVGTASYQSILWLVAWGDGGTEAAAKNADIKVIKHLDVERFLVLFGVYSEVTTIAYGD